MPSPGIRTITIRIVGDYSSSIPSATADPSVSSPGGRGSSTGLLAPSATGKPSKEEMKKYAGALFITQQAVSLLKENAEYYVGKYYSLSEDYKGQQSVENAKKVLSMATSIAASTAAGAMAFGPAAAHIGAAVGLTVGLTRMSLSNIMTMRNQTEQINAEVYSNFFQGSRVGFVNGGKGTEN